jgi:palmitoyltransferase ZDHHC13/17
MLLIFYGGIVFYKDYCEFTFNDGIWNALLKLNNCSPWVAWMLINAWFHLLWVTILTSIQIYQIVFLGMTTNERINRGRYKHFIELGGKSPFNLGPGRNIADFFGFSCFGLLQTKKNNWMVFSDKESANLISPDNDLQYV